MSEASGSLFMASITALNLAVDLVSEAIIIYAFMQTWMEFYYALICMMILACFT